MTDLRERVARALVKRRHVPHEDWLVEADAAIKLIVQECAKVAKGEQHRLRMDRAKTEVGGVQYAFLDGMQYVAGEIEAAIRALAKENKG